MAYVTDKGPQGQHLVGKPLGFLFSWHARQKKTAPAGCGVLILPMARFPSSLLHCIETIIYNVCSLVGIASPLCLVVAPSLNLEHMKSEKDTLEQLQMRKHNAHSCNSAIDQQAHVQL